MEPIFHGTSSFGRHMTVVPWTPDMVGHIQLVAFQAHLVTHTTLFNTSTRSRRWIRRERRAWIDLDIPV